MQFFLRLGPQKDFCDEDKLQLFSIECRKTETKLITLANHNSGRQSNEPINSKQIHVAGAKRGKTRVSKSLLVLVLLLIG